MLELDFIIIGAQKAGTTSLSYYLGQHTDIFIPSEKELPYFISEVMQKKGWSWYQETYFNAVNMKSFIGTSTPQYMMYPESFSTIHSYFPNIKLIVVLRDPIKRLISHYDMAKRFGVEKRGINGVIDEQLKNIEYYRNTGYDDVTGKYIVSGEYGRILNEALKFFRREQLLVLQFDNLVNSPQECIDIICGHIGAHTFLLNDIGKIRMPGGNKRKINVDHNKIMKSIIMVARILGLKRFISRKLYRFPDLITSWLDENNVDPNFRTSIESIDDDLLVKIKNLYAEDDKLLHSLGVL